MKYDEVDAFMKLANSNSVWQSNGETYESIEWDLNNTQTKPLREEVEAKLRELQQLEPYRLLRIERDRLLKETDWRASSDLNLPESWRAYRPALRDLPANAKPKLDENGDLDMSSVAWPSPST